MEGKRQRFPPKNKKCGIQGVTVILLSLKEVPIWFIRNFTRHKNNIDCFSRVKKSAIVKL